VAAICIITSTGMKCSASAIMEHRPAGKGCTEWEVPEDRDLEATKRGVRGAVLEQLGRGKKAKKMAGVIARVAELMIAAGVDGSEHFTIVKGR
jgi:hypothetical protein